MKLAWPQVALGEVLTKSEDWITIRPDVRYREVTVRYWGKGVVLRREVMGAEIAADRRMIIRPGQFILSKIDARNGALGVVPDSLDGAVVSSDFPVFTPNSQLLLPSYLRWMSRTKDFVDLCRAASVGTTNRIRLNVSKFLDTEFPLPSIAEQNRVVRIIEMFASKIEEARRERMLSNSLMAPLHASIVSSIFPKAVKNCKSVKFGSLLTRSRMLESIIPEEEYFGVGTRMWGQGAYVHEQKKGAEFNAERYAVKNGQLIYNEVWAHNGAIAIVRDLKGKTVVSRHFHVFNFDWSIYEPAFVTWIFRSPWFWSQCQDGSVGTSGRGHMRRQYLENILLPLPTLKQQRSIVEYLNKLEEKERGLKLLQDETSDGLDALLPSILDKAFKGEL